MNHLTGSALFRAFLVLGILFIGIYKFIWKGPKREANPAFYFWESRSFLDDEEDSILSSQHVKRLYVKFFEVEFNEVSGPVPISKTELELTGKESAALEIVPTIYIQNEVFKKIKSTELNDFADKVWHLIKKRFSENYMPDKKIGEIQVDCDWTISTKNNYLSFLQILKSKINCRLSATLRLYAYKFPDQMGILPVDRAMLMCYNLLPPVGSNHANSILEISELQKYLSGADKYPVPLDVALPLFSNAVVYKNDQFAGLLHSDLSDVETVLKPYSKYWSLVTQDTVFNNVTLIKGDKVKLETVSSKKLKKAIEIITENVSLPTHFNVAFYYLNFNQLKQYDAREIRAFYSAFNN